MALNLLMADRLVRGDIGASQESIKHQTYQSTTHHDQGARGHDRGSWPFGGWGA